MYGTCCVFNWGLPLSLLYVLRTVEKGEYVCICKRYVLCITLCTLVWYCMELWEAIILNIIVGVFWFSEHEYHWFWSVLVQFWSLPFLKDQEKDSLSLQKRNLRNYSKDLYAPLWGVTGELVNGFYQCLWTPTSVGKDFIFNPYGHSHWQVHHPQSITPILLLGFSQEVKWGKTEPTSKATFTPLIDPADRIHS